MPTNIGKNAFRSSMVNSVMNLVLLATGLFLTPYIMSSLGDVSNGYWVIIKIVIGYCGFVDLGVSPAIARFVAVELGKGDKARAVRIIQTGICFILSLDMLLVLLIFGASAVTWNVVGVKDGVNMGILVLITGLSVVLSLPGRVYMGVLSAHIRDDLISWATLVNTLMRTAVIFIFLKIGFGLFALMIITAVALIVLSFVFYLAVLKLMPETKGICFGIDFHILRELLGYGFSLTLAGFGDIIRWSAAPIIAAMVWGPVFVTHLNIAFSLSRYGVICLAGFFVVFMPVFGQLVGVGDKQRLKRVFYKTLHVTVPASGLVFGGMLFLGRDFITNWVGTEYLDAYTALACMSAGLMIALMQNAVVTLMQGLGLARWYAISNGIEAAMNVLLCFLLRGLGMLGFGLGMMIPMILIKLILQPALIVRNAHWSMSEFYQIFLKLFLKSVVGIGLAGMASASCQNLFCGWSGFIACGTIYTVVYAIFVAVFIMNGVARKELQNRIFELVIPAAK